MSLEEASVPLSVSAEPVARSPFARRLAARGAAFGRVGDWEVALRLPGEPERLEGGGICIADISSLPKKAYYGAGAAACVAAGTAEAVPGVVIGSTDGDRVVCVVGPNEVFIIGGGADVGVGVEDETLFAVDRTGGLASLALHGAEAPNVLRRLTALDVSDRAFASGRCAVCRVAELRGLLVHSGRDAYQVHVDRPDGEHLWDAVCEAGEGLGLRLVGWNAYRALVAGDGKAT